jgi:enterochelin esterase-like enzyme
MELKTLFFLFWFVAGHSQQMAPSAGKIIHSGNFPSKFVEPRNVDVWLPDGYAETKKYDVLYMHDGQMLFDANTTWNKQEWRADEIANRLMKEGKVREFIIVGVSSLPNVRHSNYFPQKPFEALPKKTQDSLMAIRFGENKLFGNKVNSDDYLKFLVQELKPYVEKTFSVNTGRDHTFIAGSSMGGLISLYAICEYPDVFGGAACLSTHWPGVMDSAKNPVPEAFFNYMKKKLPSPETHKIYFDCGTATLDAAYGPLQKQADRVMREKGFAKKDWTTREFAGAEHSEKSWAARLDIPLLFLLGKE